MKITEFLKPDIRRIVVFVIIAVISIYFIYISFTVPLGETTPAWVYIIYILWLPLFVFTFLPEEAPILLAIALLISITYWYLLSCLIVAAYDKIKKRKK